MLPSSSPALIPQEVPGSSRIAPRIPVTLKSEGPALGVIPAYLRSARKRHDRRDTPAFEHTQRPSRDSLVVRNVYTQT
jgi:hypothetical protein